MKKIDLKNNDVLRTLILGGIALILLIACYFVFFNEEQFLPTNGQNTMSRTENKLCSVLSEIEGVGKIIAYINEDEAGQTMGAIIVCEGADRLSVRLNVTKAAAMALGVEQNTILVYKMI